MSGVCFAVFSRAVVHNTAAGCANAAYINIEVMFLVAVCYITLEDRKHTMQLLTLSHSVNLWSCVLKVDSDNAVDLLYLCKRTHS